MLKHPTWLLLVLCWWVFRASSGAWVYDEGELVSAAWRLGGSHPPGQPLHALYAHLFAWLPLGPIPFRVALASAVAETFAASTAFYLTLAWLRTLRPATSAKSTKTATWAAHAATLGVLLSPPLLQQATRVEVYGLALALTGLGLIALATWMSQTNKQTHTWLRVAAFCGGLAAAVHPPHACVLVLFGAMGLVCFRRDAFRGSTLLWAAALFVLGASVLVYLPLRALAGAPMWGKPTTWRGFIAYVTAQAYHQNLGGQAVLEASNLSATLQYITWATGVVPFLGWLGWLRQTSHTHQPTKQKTLAVALLAVCACLAIGLLQPHNASNPDNIAYLGPAMLPILSLGAAGIAYAVRKRVLCALCLALLAVQLPQWPHISAATHASPPALYTARTALTENPPPRALVIVSTDAAATQWLLARDVAGARPDIALFITGLATSSWHWNSLQTHPAFDGTPSRRPPGDSSTPTPVSTRQAYTQGVIDQAKALVPIVVESPH